MKEGQASRTAEYMALFRALESTEAPARRLFEDRFAAAFLAPRFHLVVSFSRFPLVGAIVRAYIDRRWPGARTSAVARTRFIDDALEAALNEGIAQVMILGAGFDARAYRIAAMARVPVFEVDHPLTSATKRAMVEATLGSIPSLVRFIAVDFNSGSWQSAITSSGYDPHRRSLFIWEGVTNYLTEDAVDRTLRWCASAASGSKMLFTYVHSRVLDEPHAFDGTDRLFATLSAADERWTFGRIHPASAASWRSAGSCSRRMSAPQTTAHFISVARPIACAATSSIESPSREFPRRRRTTGTWPNKAIELTAVRAAAHSQRYAY